MSDYKETLAKQLRYESWDTIDRALAGFHHEFIAEVIDIIEVLKEDREYEATSEAQD